MNVETIRDLYVTELQRAHAMETKLLDGLERLESDAAVDSLDEIRLEEVRDQLREAIAAHREETEVHVERLETALGALDSAPEDRSTPALDGLLEQKEMFNNVVLNDEIRPLFYLGTGQQIEHLESTTYEQLLDVGSHLDLPPHAYEPLEDTLAEEEAMQETLSELRQSAAFDELLDALAAEPGN